MISLSIYGQPPNHRHAAVWVQHVNGGFFVSSYFKRSQEERCGFQDILFEEVLQTRVKSQHTSKLLAPFRPLSRDCFLGEWRPCIYCAKVSNDIHPPNILNVLGFLGSRFGCIPRRPDPHQKPPSEENTDSPRSDDLVPPGGRSMKQQAISIHPGSMGNGYVPTTITVTGSSSGPVFAGGVEKMRWHAGIRCAD